MFWELGISSTIVAGNKAPSQCTQFTKMGVRPTSSGLFPSHKEQGPSVIIWLNLKESFSSLYFMYDTGPHDIRGKLLFLSRRGHMLVTSYMHKPMVKQQNWDCAIPGLAFTVILMLLRASQYSSKSNIIKIKMFLKEGWRLISSSLVISKGTMKHLQASQPHTFLRTKNTFSSTNRV